MRIHSFEHAPAEGAGKIAEWAKARGHAFSVTRFDLEEAPPPVDEIDLLVIMGGGMNIHQHRDFPWLIEEKRAIATAIERSKALLGVCLGGQLIADALGGKVVQNPVKEIGWFPVRFMDRSAPLDGFPSVATVFHWHGDTFSIPPGARRVAESDGCESQAFVYGEKIVGLQFHLEVTPAAAAAFCCGADMELKPARFVQSRAEIEGATPDLQAADAGLARLLEHLTR
jgi:GMP synthase-like glutamine amidotransferase